MSLPPLTTDILKTLKFYTLVHINFGDDGTAMSKKNDKYDLMMISNTDGPPNYCFTRRVLETCDGSIVSADE